MFAARKKISALSPSLPLASLHYVIKSIYVTSILKFRQQVRFYATLIIAFLSLFFALATCVIATQNILSPPRWRCSAVFVLYQFPFPRTHTRARIAAHFIYGFLIPHFFGPFQHSSCGFAWRKQHSWRFYLSGISHRFVLVRDKWSLPT